VTPEHDRDRQGQAEGTPAVLRLRLADLVRQGVEGRPDRHRAGVEVDVGPAEGQQIALARPEADGGEEEGSSRWPAMADRKAVTWEAESGDSSKVAFDGGSTSVATFRATRPDFSARPGAARSTTYEYRTVIGLRSPRAVRPTSILVTSSGVSFASDFLPIVGRM
jgi:hypothetical protein